jgi:hypothetical protein
MREGIRGRRALVGIGAFAERGFWIWLLLVWAVWSDLGCFGLMMIGSDKTRYVQRRTLVS